MVNGRFPNAASVVRREGSTRPAMDAISRVQNRAIRRRFPAAIAKIVCNFSANSRSFASNKQKLRYPANPFQAALLGCSRSGGSKSRGRDGVGMFFLLRTAFWLEHRARPAAERRDAAEIGRCRRSAPLEAVSAATAAVSDMSQFCERQPDACEVGGQAATAFGQRAQAGAKMVYEFLQRQDGPGETGSVDGARASADQAARSDTLKPADLEPAWRGPRRAKPRRQTRRPA